MLVLKEHLEDSVPTAPIITRRHVHYHSIIYVVPPLNLGGVQRVPLVGPQAHGRASAIERTVDAQIHELRLVLGNLLELHRVHHELASSLLYGWRVVVSELLLELLLEHVQLLLLLIQLFCELLLSLSLQLLLNLARRSFEPSLFFRIVRLRQVEHKVLDYERRLNEEFVPCSVHVPLLSRHPMVLASFPVWLRLLAAHPSADILRGLKLHVAQEVNIRDHEALLRRLHVLLLSKELVSLILQRLGEVLFVFPDLIVAEKVAAQLPGRTHVVIFCWRLSVSVPPSHSELLDVLFVLVDLIAHGGVLGRGKDVVVYEFIFRPRLGAPN